MKVAFNDQIFVHQKYGGISRYYYNLVKAISESSDINATIFAPFHINGFLSQLPKEAVFGKQYSNKFKLYYFFPKINNVIVPAAIDRFKPNVIHETYYSRKGLGRSDCPTVVTVHDMIHELFPENFSKKDKTREVKLEAVNRADHVICVSNNTKLDLMRLLDIPEDKISVVYHGVENFMLSQAPPTVVNKAGRSFILYVGHREGYKNFQRFAEAVASSNRLMNEFDIITFGGGGFSTRERKLFSKLGFSENQVVNESGNDATLDALYRSARVLVYPSLYEGFGIPPLEAMASNCPVVCSNTSSIPEVVGNAAELFDPENIEEMASAMENVLFSKERREQLIQHGKEHIKKFSWKKCAIETLRVYQKLCN